MSLLNKLIFILLFAGFYSPSFAAVEGADQLSCSVFSNEEGGDKKEPEEEEEPDCE